MSADEMTLAERRARMVEINLRFGQENPEPYLVYVPRVPVVGERFTGPDDFGSLVVVSVTYEYPSGFAYPPELVTVETEGG